MEPPAAKSFSRVVQQQNNAIDKGRREMTLRIEPRASYYSPSRFEELPENFLESISPQQTSVAVIGGPSNSSNLVGSMSPNHVEHLDQRFSESADLISGLSNDGVSSTAGLLMHSSDDINSCATGSALLDEHQQPTHQFIKEESPGSLSYHVSDCDGVYNSFGSELGRLNDVVAGNHDSNYRSSVFLQEPKAESVDNDQMPSISALVGLCTAPEINSPNAAPFSIADALNAELDDDVFIDTRDLCKRVACELKQHSIPQAVFAERILCRSQGTLSDLLRNPKPWDKLKSGRETFRRMFNWIQQPLHLRLAILDIYKPNGGNNARSVSPPLGSSTPNRIMRTRPPSSGDESTGHGQKRPRLVFSDIQKRTLQAIFKETQRPSREMQQTIADHLGLDMSTVSNFFMNARRRSRNGLNVVDDAASDVSGSQTEHTRAPRKSGKRRRNSDSARINETVDEVISICKKNVGNPNAELVPKTEPRSSESRESCNAGSPSNWEMPYSKDEQGHSQIRNAELVQ